MLLTPPLRPGEGRDLDLSGGKKKDEYARPGIVAHTVVVGGVAYENGVFVYNSNVEPSLSERADEDLTASLR